MQLKQIVWEGGLTMDGFKDYEFTLKDDATIEINAENIFEALEQVVRFSNIHPSEIVKIEEVA